jgi:hypothetical protein
VVQLESGYVSRLRVRSLVGIIPLFAVEVIRAEEIEQLAAFMSSARGIIRTRPDLATLISRIVKKNEQGAT